MTSLPQLEIYRPYEDRPSQTPRSGVQNGDSGLQMSDLHRQPTYQQSNYPQEAPPPYVHSDSHTPDAAHGSRMLSDNQQHVFSNHSQRHSTGSWSSGSSPAYAAETKGLDNYHHNHQSGLFLPVVLPQTARAFRGSFYAPFVRAYAPSLAQHGISKSDFLTFIDGLNECWVANPALDGVGLAGTIMGQFHGLPVVQIVGAGVEVAAGVSSAATSIARSKMYFKAINANLLHPAGLHAQACSTKDMMAKIGHSEQELKLVPLDSAVERDGYTASDGAVSSSDTPAVADDSRVRKMKALGGYVSPLDFDVPMTVAPSNLLKKMGHAQTEHMVKKHAKRETRKREEDAKTRERKATKADKAMRKALEKVEEAEEKLFIAKVRMEQKLARYEDKPKEQDRLRRELEREEKKLQKEVERGQAKCDQELEKQSQKRAEAVAKPKDREEEATQKIQWVVITRWFGDGKGEAGSEDASSSEHDFERALA